MSKSTAPPADATAAEFKDIPDDTCPYSGVERDEGPRHDLMKYKENKIYVVKPFGTQVEYAKGIGIVYLTSVSGIWYNHLMLADQFAAAGYWVAMPNYLDKVNEKPPFADGTADKSGVVSDGLTQAQKNQTILDAIQLLQRKGCTKIGAVGFCAGGPQVVKLLTNNFDTVLAGFVAHPSVRDVAPYEKIKRPLSIATGTDDTSTPQAKRNLMEKALLKSGVPFQMNLFSGVDHGFAVRRIVGAAREQKRQAIWAKQQAFTQAVTFLNEHLQ